MHPLHSHFFKQNTAVLISCFQNRRIPSAVCAVRNQCFSKFTKNFEDACLLSAQKVNADGKILFDDLSNAHMNFRFQIVQSDKTLQNSGEEKACRRSPEDRSKSKSSANQTARKRSDETGNSLYLIDSRIALHQIVSREHLGNAGLYRGKLKSRQNHQQYTDNPNIIPKEQH